MCQQLGWRVNLEKSELEPNQDFDFVGYQFDFRSDFRSDRFRPTLDWVQNLQETVKTAIPTGLPGPGIHVLDRLLTSTEKHVNLGRLHMRPIQWHLKNNWRVSRITAKGDPSPQVPAPPFTMAAEGRQCTYSPTITPNKTCSANIYRRINRRVGRSLR